jgi:hypothetical protein
MMRGFILAANDPFEAHRLLQLHAVLGNICTVASFPKFVLALLALDPCRQLTILAVLLCGDIGMPFVADKSADF